LSGASRAGGGGDEALRARLNFPHLDPREAELAARPWSEKESVSLLPAAQLWADAEPEPPPRPRKPRPELAADPRARAFYGKMRVKALKAVLERRGLDAAGCADKKAVVERILRAEADAGDRFAAW
jgi:hypothetical protein